MTAAGRRTLVVALGATQIVSWGSIYYAFSVLIAPLAGATGASMPGVVGAFSAALLVTGVLSPAVGRAVDRHGGRAVMAGGSLLAAVLLAALAHVHAPWQLYAVWCGLGAAMAATLYDPAFAVLVRVFGPGARRAITALTLFGGLASTVFWPLTQALVDALGWQQALYVLAAVNAVLCVPVHALVLPRGPGAALAAGQDAAPVRAPSPRAEAAPAAPRPHWRRDPLFLTLCVAFTGNALVFSAMSVHLLPLLQAKGVTPAQAAWIGALVGPMQVAGRVAEFVFLGGRSATRVGLLAMWLLPVSIALFAVLGGASALWLVFALLYGSGNGVMTIVRGAVPAELYGQAHYGAANGAMAAPVMVAKAAGPIAGATLLAASGQPAVLLGALVAVSAAAALVFGRAAARAGARPSRAGPAATPGGGG